MLARIERLMELLNVLIGADRPVSAERIRQRVPGYPDDDASFQRQFERDKKALRDMGLPVDATDIPGTYPPMPGYRIASDQAHLRDPGLEPDELAAIGLAASAIRLEGIEGSGGLWKLGGAVAPAGPGVDRRPDGVIDLPADDRLVDLFTAAAECRVVTFGYRGTVRHLEPWRLDCLRGRWYVSGHDRDRGELRHFRLERIDGSITSGPARAFERPLGRTPGVRMEAWQFGSGPLERVDLLVDAGHLDAVLQVAPTATVVEERADGSTVVALQASDPDALRTLVLGFLDHVEVLGPPSRRADLVTWLEGVVEAQVAP